MSQSPSHQCEVVAMIRSANCSHADSKKHGRDRYGNQRFRCRDCGKTWAENKPRPLGPMQINIKRAVFALQLLLEGCSIRSTERITGIARNTLTSLVLTVGEQCERFFSEAIRGVDAKSSIECDEIWSFTHCKEKTRERVGLPEDYGDCWVHTAIDRSTKLLYSFHVGRRSNADTREFASKLADAVAGRVQINTDGLTNYIPAIGIAFGNRVDHAAVVKVFAGGDHDHKYSPATVTEIKKVARRGNPDLDNASTSIMERGNLTIRTNLRRFTRLTIAFSKSRRHHAAMFALWATWYNFARPHGSLNKATPAMAHGLSDHRWSIEELIHAVAEFQ